MSWTENSATHTEFGNTWTVAQPGFVVELYGGANVLPHGRAIFERIWALFPRDKPFFFINKRGRSYKQLTPTSLTRLVRTLEKLDEEGQFYMLKDSPDFHIEAYSAELGMGSEGAIVHFGLPTRWIAEVGADAAVELFRSFVADFGFSTGTAGWGFQLTWGRECEMKAMPLSIKAAKRFWGLNVRNRNEESHLGGKLKTAHWLTFLGEAALDACGGIGAAKELAPDVGVVEVGTGVILRAGKEPPEGDVNRQAPDIEPLRRVNKFIRPVRIDAWRYGHNLFFIEPDDAHAWLTRLD